MIIMLMVKRKMRLFSDDTTIRVDEWLYNTCQELMDIFTNFGGSANYQRPFLTLSDTILTLSSYSIAFNGGLLSKDEKYLRNLLSEANKKQASSIVSLNYDGKFNSLVKSLILKYNSIDIKISFSEAVRVALYNFVQIYNSEPERPLLTFFVLISSTDPISSNLSDTERLSKITFTEFPVFEPSLKNAIKKYYANLADEFINIFDQGTAGSRTVSIEKLKIAVPSTSNFRESFTERTSYAVESAITDMTCISYIAYVTVSKLITERVTKELYQSGSYPRELSSVYTVFPQSFMPFSVFSVLPYYHTLFKEELQDVIGGKIRPILRDIITMVFP